MVSGGALGLLAGEAGRRVTHYGTPGIELAPVADAF